MAVGVAEEASDLMAPLDWGGEEFRPALAEGLVGASAVGNADRHLGARPVGVGGRRERHGRLVVGGPASGDEQKPVPQEAKDRGGAAVLAVELGPEHVA